MDSMIGCGYCGGKAKAGRMLCAKCEADYLHILRGLNRQLQALNSVALKQARIGQPEHRPSDGFAPSPIDWDAWQLLEVAALLMRSLCAELNPQWARIPLRQWRGLWIRLIANKNTLLSLPTAAEDYRDLKTMAERIDKRLAPPVERVRYGHCPSCGADVMAPRGAQYADCEACGVELRLAEVRLAYFDSAAATELGEAARDGLHITRTRSGAAEWLSEATGRRFSGKQVENWRRRGKLPSCNKAGDGYWEWSVRELLACAGGE